MTMLHSYAWTRRLPDAAIEEILDGLHDSLAGSLRKALFDEIWRRHSYPLHAWLRVDGADAVHVCARLWRRLRAEDWPDRTGTFYRESMQIPREGHAPGRVIRTDGVLSSYAGTFSCTCGWRGGGAVAVGNGHVNVGVPAWPVVRGRRRVCPYAPTLSSCLHGPLGDAGCICGWRVGAWSRTKTEWAYVPLKGMP